MLNNTLRRISLGSRLSDSQIRYFYASGTPFPLERRIVNNGVSTKASPSDLRNKSSLPVFNNQCRSMSQWVVQWENMRKRRPLPRKNLSAHYPPYVGVEDSRQLDSLQAKQVSSETIAKVNEQIQDHNHGRLFAVIQVAGKQFKVTPEDIIVIQGYWAPKIGEKLLLEKILLVGGTDFTVVGRPLVSKNLVRIEATVIEKTMSFTKLNFTLVPRQRQRKLHFYKTPYTMVRINSIEFDGLIDKEDVEGNEELEMLAPSASTA